MGLPRPQPTPDARFIRAQACRPGGVRGMRGEGFWLSQPCLLSLPIPDNTGEWPHHQFTCIISELGLHLLFRQDLR